MWINATGAGRQHDRAMAHSLPAKTAAADRRRWLSMATRAGGWRIQAAAALLVMDGLAAVGFAGGLAGALAALPRGWRAAMPWLLLGVAAALARGACAWGAARAGGAGSAIVRAALRRRAIVACLGQPPAIPRSGAAMATVAVDGVEQLDGYLARFQPARRATAPVSLVVLIAVACASPISAAIMAATLVPFVALMALAGGAAADQSRRQFAALARLSAMFADRLRCLPAILCCQAETAQTDQLASAAQELRRRTISVLRIAFVSSAGLEFFAALSVALVAVYAGFSLLGLLPFTVPLRLTLAEAIFVLALAPECYAPLRRLAAAYHDRQTAETAADRLMALDQAAQSGPHHQLARPPLAAPPLIRFVAATTQYPQDDRPALDRLSFTARPGEIVVLLGPSGAGKTTALNLLLGLAPLTGGEIWINTTPQSQAAPQGASWSQSIAWMGQNPIIMPGSIAENIALSRQTAPLADIARAADRVGLCALLRARGGLDQHLDERGSGLSGGERRRIALARALLKAAPILLLDEPTAHLDAAAEADLILAIKRAAHGRTTIIATHSHALARIADQVVRLGDAAPQTTTPQNTTPETTRPEIAA
jgi:ATP-binding cassette subfamily C protein CydD